MAVPFTPTANFNITFLDLALIHLGGDNSALVELCEDSSGIPGAVLGSWTVGGVPYPYAEAGVPASGQVRSGVQYWLAIQPGGGDTALGWALNSQGISGVYAATRDATTYSTDNYTLPAFEVLGDPVPEPSAPALVAAGLALLAVVRWTANSSSTHLP